METDGRVVISLTPGECTEVRYALYYLLYNTDYFHTPEWELDEEKHLHIRELYLRLERWFRDAPYSYSEDAPYSYSEESYSILVDQVTYTAILAGLTYLASNTYRRSLFLTNFTRRLEEYTLSVAVAEALRP